MDWNCPTYDQVFADQLYAMYGNLSPETGIQNISAILQSGDNFVHWADLTPTTNHLYVSFASANGEGGPANAYDRAFTRFSMTEVYAVSPPTSDEIEDSAHARVGI